MYIVDKWTTPWGLKRTFLNKQTKIPNQKTKFLKPKQFFCGGMFLEFGEYMGLEYWC